MYRSMFLAGAVLILAGHSAIAGVRPLSFARAPGLHADGAVRPAVVMFNLALVRRHMLDTLTELIAAVPRSKFSSSAPRADAGIPATPAAANRRY